MKKRKLTDSALESRRIWVLLFLFVTMGISVYSQDISIKGTVIDAQNEPLIGVSVVVKGTQIGTITDLDGQYNIKTTDQSATLIYSYMGFTTQEIRVAGKTTINVTLEEDVAELEEVVVVGFGVQKKVNLSGSISTIDNKMLEGRPMSNVSAGLQGLLPGVTIVQASGKPGGDSGTIRVRGVGTLNNSDPMIIIDGVEGTMDNLDPNDIEQLTVLKDAGSAAIYGAKAANGVILITTKRGTEGKTRINYSGLFGWQSATDKPKYLSSADYATLYNEALVNDEKSPRFSDNDIQLFRDGSSPYTHPNTDWQDLLYKGSGFQTNHNASISGGDKKTRYMTSLGYVQQDGLVKNTSKKQYNLRTNIDYKILSNLDFGVNVSYSRMDLEEPTNSYVGGGLDQIFRQVNIIAPWIPYKDENGDYGVSGDGNPIAWLDLNQKIKKRRDYMTTIATLSYKPIDDLTLKGVASYKTYKEDENEFVKDIQYNPSKYHGPNKMHQKDRSNETFTTDLYATYNKTFMADHNLTVLGGFHSEYYHEKYRYSYRENFPNNEFEDMNGGSESGMKSEGYSRELAMLSWFGRLNYDYAGKYLFEANLRYDGTSRFAKDNRWGAFPSVSGAWRISEEDFMANIKDDINNLKVRASWGKLGNQGALQKEYYPTIQTMTLKDVKYPFGDKIVSGAYTKYATNPNLKWESARTWGVGLDMGFNNGISFSVDYYDRLSTDVIIGLPAPETFALEKYIDNAAEISNRGIEISLQYNKKVGNVGLGFGGNFSYNINKIKYLVNDRIYKTNENWDEDDRILRVIGHPINSLYGYKTDGLFKSQKEINEYVAKYDLSTSPKPGDIRYVDTNGDKIISTADKVLIGNIDPKYTFSFNVSAEYKGFDMMIYMQGVAGVDGYMDSEAYGDMNGDSGKATKFWMDRWSPDNPNGSAPRLTAKGKEGLSMPANISTFWMQDAKYLRLKNLQIGYTIPKRVLSKIGIEKIRVYYSGQNLLTFTNFAKGWDPEAPIGRGSHYPQVMVNSLGVNVTF